MYGRPATAHIISMLQEGAAAHADELGVGLEYLVRSGLTWMLSRMSITFHAWPAPADHLNIATWPAGSRRGLIALRQYQCHDQNLRLLLEATSEWLLVDTQRERITRLTPEIMSLESSQPPPPSPFPKASCESPPDWSVTIPVRRADLDINRHVNNIHYISWLTEPLPDGWQTRRLLNLDIVYRHGAKHGDTLTSSSYAVSADKLYHRIERTTDASILCEAYSAWHS